MLGLWFGLRGSSGFGLRAPLSKLFSNLKANLNKPSRGSASEQLYIVNYFQTLSKLLLQELYSFLLQVRRGKLKHNTGLFLL